MAGLFDGPPLQRPVTCEACGKPIPECRCPRTASGRILLPKDQAPRVQRERRAGGKTMTVISGLDPVASDLPRLLSKLKTACAAGGGIADGCVEIQGDHRDRIVQLLKGMGYAAKASGG